MLADHFTAAAARVEFAADALGLTDYPRQVLDRNGTPTVQLLKWADQHNVSLDWIFRGDVSGLLRSAAKTG